MKTRTEMAAAMLALALWWAFSAGALHAQSRNRALSMQPWATEGPQVAERSQPLEFDNGPFDRWMKQLPPFYVGYEPGILYSRIKGRARGSDSVFAVRLSPGGRFFDTRTLVLSVYCRLSGILQDGKEDETLRGLSVKYVPQVDNRYTGADTLGARVEIEEIKFQEYMIAFPNFREFSVEKPESPHTRQAMEKESKKYILSDGAGERPAGDSIVGTIRLTPSEAKQQLWKRVAVLLVFTPIPPYATQESVEERPVDGRIGDRLAQYYYIHARLLGLWFYDLETGKILLKVQPGGGVKG